MIRGQMLMVTAVAGTSCPFGYKGAPFPSYFECRNAMERYEALSFLKVTCMPCFWGGEVPVRFPAKGGSENVVAVTSTAETILEFTLEDNADSGKGLFFSRGSSACWGIPGLAPQSDGSVNVVPDEGNLACTASGRDYDYYQHLIVPLIYDTKFDFWHRNEELIAEVEFYGNGYNRTGVVEWEYGCKLLDPEQHPDYNVTCAERPPTHDYSKQGYTITIERATAASDVMV